MVNSSIRQPSAGPRWNIRSSKLASGALQHIVLYEQEIGLQHFHKVVDD